MSLPEHKVVNPEPWRQYSSASTPEYTPPSMSATVSRVSRRFSIRVLTIHNNCLTLLISRKTLYYCTVVIGRCLLVRGFLSLPTKLKFLQNKIFVEGVLKRKISPGPELAASDCRPALYDPSDPLNAALLHYIM